MREFLKVLFLNGTQYSLYICSLVNDRSQKGERIERHIITRDLDYVEEFLGKFDQAGRGMFVGMSTFAERSKRLKETAKESTVLWCDIDLKSINLSLEEVIKILKACPKPPTAIVFSGNGVHAYWRFTEVMEASEEVEDVCRMIAGVFAGDTQVAQRAAIMRLPGSHNTKFGKWTEVTVQHLDENLTYTLEEMRDWALKSPVLIERKDAPEKPTAEKNPFLQYAEEFAYKPPIDVEQRLAEMQYQGPGDTSIHATQVAVTASMLSNGVALETVVETVLNRTKEVAPEGWDWKVEEKTIRDMCKTWMRKLQKKEERASNVISINERRVAKQAEPEEPEEEEDKKEKPKKNVVHRVLGAGFLEALKRRGDGILICREELWRCSGGLWTMLSPGEAKSWIEREMEEGCRALGIVSTQKVINEARAWVMRNPDIYMQEVPWDEHGMIATRSGLLDPKTNEIIPVTPEHYVSMRIECEYDPSATCPRWIRMLDDIFPQEPETIMAVQEISGMGLHLDRARHLRRAAVFVGPAASGKSNLLNVLSGMFTKVPNTTSFDLLDNAHGTVDFLRNVPWVLHEAFDQAKWHFSSVVKAILSGDPIQINIKNGPQVQRSFKFPVFWGTNVPPQFKESTRAIEGRIRIIKCKQVFDLNSVKGIAKEATEKGYSSPSEYVLDTEMPGLLNWFLEGMKRATSRGYLLDTDEMRQSSAEMRTNSNYMTPFFEDCVDYSSTHMVSRADLFATLKGWWEENKGDSRISIESMIKNIDSLYDGRVVTNPKVLRWNTKTYVAGIMLNEVGQNLWSAMSGTASAKGDSARLSTKLEDVNVKIPAEWNDKPIIKAMIEAHKEKKNG